MKLNKEDVSNLVGVFDTCLKGDINDVVIEDGVVYGVNDSKSVAIISDFKIPNLGQKAGFMNIKLLKSILDTFRDTELSVDSEETDRGEIRSIAVKSGRSKAEFRCTSTALLKPPRKINDATFCKVVVEKDEMALVLNMIKTFGPKSVTICIKSNGNTSIQGSSAGGNNFQVDLRNTAVFEGDAETVVHHYLPNIFASIMREMNSHLDNFYMNFGELGSLGSKLNGHDFIILPYIEQDD